MSDGGRPGPGVPEASLRSLIVESRPLREAPLLRREPYLVLFPLGIALSWAGVGHWLLHALGLLDTYQPVFHAMTQIQGFLICFAAGFLLTMIPRRTGSDPPATWEIAACCVAPVVTTIAAWNQRWMLAQGAWLVLAFTLIAFGVRRFTSATSARRPPNAFVWIPAALAMGIAGSLLTATYAVDTTRFATLHEIGRKLVLQGMFVGLVLGVGALAFPLMTRGEAPPDAAATARDRIERMLHLLAAALLVASFVLETTVSLRGALVLRFVVVTAALIGGARLWRLPSGAGWNRRLIWVAGWMLPAGYALAAAFPDRSKAGLHVAFLGGFAMLALGVSIQVTAGHRGYRSVLVGRPWQIAAVGAAMLVAVAARIAMEFDRVRYFGWMGVAAAAFLAATLAWAHLVVPKMLVRSHDA